MTPELKDEIRKMVIDNYGRGSHDALEGLIEGFKAIRQRGVLALTVDQIIDTITVAKQASADGITDAVNEIQTQLPKSP